MDKIAGCTGGDPFSIRRPGDRAYLWRLAQREPVELPIGKIRLIWICGERLHLWLRLVTVIDKDFLTIVRVPQPKQKAAWGGLLVEHAGQIRGDVAMISFLFTLQHGQFSGWAYCNILSRLTSSERRDQTRTFRPREYPKRLAWASYSIARHGEKAISNAACRVGAPTESPALTCMAGML